MSSLTAEEVRDVFYYDGWNLIWRNPLKSSWTGRKAGTVDGQGYVKVYYNGRPYKAHRLIWLYAYGAWPKQIDHINHNKQDNRLSNLRSVESKQNNTNASKGKNNKSGKVGVSWHKKAKKWQAQIMVDYKNKYLGLFKNIEDALKIRKEAEIKYGFHPNHGGS